MAKKYAYLETGETFLTLGNVGLAIYITGQKSGGSAESAVGTLFVGKAGIRWLPKKKWPKQKGRRVVGAPISWDELDELSNKIGY